MLLLAIIFTLPVIQFPLTIKRYFEFILGFLTIAFFVCSCGKSADEPNYYTKAQATKRIDSLAQIEYNKIAREADKDLAIRMQIEVREKGDSILHYQDSIAHKKH